VARRIELPSADVLFGDEGGTAVPRKAKKPEGGKPPARRETAPRGGKKSHRRATTAAAAAGAPTRPSTPVDRLESLESRLSELPVESLIDLRDGLEELLTADRIDEDTVRRLLDAVEV
jgi:hypothetical protein